MSRSGVMCAVGFVVLLAALGARGDDVSVPDAAPDVADLQRRLAEAESAIRDLQAEAPVSTETGDGGFQFPGGDRLHLGGEGAVAWFDNAHPDGSPDDGFRVDEALLHLDAKLHEDIYVCTEIKIVERESQDEILRLGELYVDFENLGGARAPDGLVGLRVGAFDTPFGEEYRTRDAIDNPLVSHSLMDFWGVDEGVGTFGKAGAFDYALAIQNGGDPRLEDGDSDKAVIARVGWQPVSRLRLSLSAMRTGDLDVEDDETSEMWFGGGVFVPIGAPETTTTFGVDVIQADARWRWQGGHVAAAVGGLEYEDNDTAADNDRDAAFGSLELEQTVHGGFYAAARVSQIHSSEGMPIIGQAAFERLLAPPWVTDIWRASLAGGYRWSRDLVLKAEYSAENGEYDDGSDLEDADLASVQLAFAF